MKEEDLDPLSLELRDRPEIRLSDFLTKAQAREVAAELGISASDANQLETALRQTRKHRG